MVHGTLYLGRKWCLLVGLTGETGINAISTTSQKSGKTYNVLGQQVSAGAKGLLIRDGKKFVVK